MKLRELIFENVKPTFAKSGNKTVRKYRCTSGNRKGRVVAKAATCSAPTNVKASVSLKKTKAKKGAKMQIKTRRTKAANAASVRSKRLNQKTNRKNHKRRSKI
mgnify:FL=1|jgi:hypothetical protein